MGIVRKPKGSRLLGFDRGTGSRLWTAKARQFARRPVCLLTHAHFPAQGGSIILTRSEITGSFAKHATRSNQGPSVSDIYNQLIPYLISRNDAKLLVKEGKKEVYAFRAE